ncbi:lanthionine synthetase C family protein [Streptomyces sp. NPDC007346]|uniref:lanthionine synthetase C family protein n=1 Tax=Streptomyces sp. NPDC007346 TaxID=3154682 RepID=UPI0034538F27
MSTAAPTTAAPKHAEKARRTADRIADHLRDPLNLAPPKPDAPLVSLASGFAGLSLLHTSRATGGDAEERAAAHRYLSAAAAAMKQLPTPRFGLHYDLCGLGFAVALAQGAGGGYGRALESLDAEAVQATHAICEHVESEPLGSMTRFDALEGLAGITRHLLLRGLGGDGATERALTCLTAMVEPAEHHGEHVPRFWSTSPPNWHPRTAPAVRELGHLNLGLAHGIAGPLAVLSTAFAEGAAVPGQASAIARIVGLLERFRGEDRYGTFWPNYVSLAQWADPSIPHVRSRVSWCYGAPGVSRALQIAGRALGEESWLRTAQASVDALCDLPLDLWHVDHWSFCHGWAGNMHVLRHFTDGPNGGRVTALVDTAAEQIIDTFEDGLPAPFEIGLAYLTPGNEPAGLLEGVSGLALALRSYADPGEPTPWDSAFLVS